MYTPCQVVKLENEAPDMDCFGSNDKSTERDPERQPLARETESANPKLGPLVKTLMKSKIYIYTILTGDKGAISPQINWTPPLVPPVIPQRHRVAVPPPHLVFVPPPVLTSPQG